MAGRTALIYSPEYEGRGMSPITQAWARYGATFRLVRELGLLDNGVEIVEPVPATEAELQLAHAESYVHYVQKMDQLGEGFLDGVETPAYPGVYRRAALSVGGSLHAARRIARGDFDHAFNPSGGLHHAREHRAGGFCVFNDLAMVARLLRRELGMERIAIVDVDGHHADGTQAILYAEPILKISLHMYSALFYPGTGTLDETGEGEGTGYAINVPLPPHTGHAAYLHAFDEVVEPLLRRMAPQFLLLQFGVDGHYRDPMVLLDLTARTYQGIAGRMHRLAHELCDGRLLVLGGGGYQPDDVARCWAVMLATISGVLPAESRARFEALFDESPPPEREKVTGRVEQIIFELKARNFPLFWQATGEPA